MASRSFWAGKRVFLTGHTGFKGGWLALWLQTLGAKVYGYALEPPTQPNLFEAADVAAGMDGVIADIRDGNRLHHEIAAFGPDIIIHMAAQSLVRASYDDPLGTYATNVMGTVHLFEAARRSPTTRVVINVTSDKCYENREWHWGYREIEAMGGHDPYSSSKGCAELVTGAYIRSFFRPEANGALVASVRAGNVIGGGDWAKDRLLPDIMRAFFADQVVAIRNPESVRPWQHVLEPLRGYLMLAERLWENGGEFMGGWNFGPHADDVQPVRSVLALLRSELGDNLRWETPDKADDFRREAGLLKLDTSKAQTFLGWRPVWGLNDALGATAAWYRAAHKGKGMRAMTLAQISAYVASAERTGQSS
jgi:CDP-glucose 4,6-dehydratase